MSRWGIDPPDDDAYDIQYDGTACDDCGCPSVAWLCAPCSDQRDAHTSALEQRLAAMHVIQERPATNEYVNNIPSVDVALAPISHHAGPVVECGLIPVVAAHVFETDSRFLARMAKAILSADLTNIREVA